MSELVIQLMLLQVALPLALIVLNAILPTASLPGLVLRSAAIALLIVHAMLAGIWLFPPWWTPHLLLVLHLAGTAIALWRRRGRAVLAGGWRAFGELAVGVAGAVAALYLLLPAVAGRTPPADAVELAMPLGPGTYLVVSGGATQAINAHLGTLTPERARPYRGQSHAVDIIGIDDWGLHAEGAAPPDPQLYRIYGAEVLAPCAGTVVLRVDGLPDMRVPEGDREHLLGNGVMLACGEVFVLLAHFAPGSLAVQLDEEVAVGQLLGRVGNSGNSNEPHLHIHVQRGMPEAMPLGGEPAWFTIDGRFLLRNQVFTVG